MIKSALIIAPHPDDEINIAGGLYDTLFHHGIYTTVVLCTNGDYLASDARKRFHEAKQTQRVFNYQELIFLGYGDSYPEKHIYDTREGEITTSYYGACETYSSGENPEYSFSARGIHQPYTRNSLKTDLRSVIIEKKAELIICVDLDSHFDHRCISLLFDECMGEIIKSDKNYRPCILKSFAYNGVWFGPDDYFDQIIKPTSIELRPNDTIEKKTFPYDWNNRIRLANDAKVNSLRWWKNPIYKALKENKTQSDYYKVGFCALACFSRIANPDSCYFYRSPYNMTLFSDVSATSGNSKYLNDFLLAVPECSITEDLPIRSKGWTPDPIDETPIILITFPKVVFLSRIVIYQNINSRISQLSISFDNKEFCDYFCNPDNVICIKIPSISVKSLRIKLVSFNDDLTINEIECYENEHFFPWDELPFEKYEDHIVRRGLLLTFISKFGFKIFIKCIMFRSWLKSRLSIQR